MSEKSAADYLAEATESFRRVVDFSMRVSLVLNGAPATEQTELSSFVHTKMCITGASIEHMLRARLNDHSAIIALCRMIMEASVLFMYLQEAVGDDEWACRYLSLKLHDTVNRIKLMRAYQNLDEQADLRKGREEPIEQLKTNAFFKSLPEEQAKRLLTGDHFYIRGVRKAVEKSAHWDGEKYMSLYSYFSSHAHSAPMSFFRMRQHGISFSDPAEFQMVVVVSALSVAEYSLLKATLGHLAESPDYRTRFKAEELEDMEKTLESCKSHFESASSSDA
jgi:hypothetical protein